MPRKKRVKNLVNSSKCTSTSESVAPALSEVQVETLHHDAHPQLEPPLQQTPPPVQPSSFVHTPDATQEVQTPVVRKRVGRESTLYWSVEALDSQGITKRLKVKVKELQTLDARLRVVVEFDDLNAAIGEAQGLLAGFCGNLAVDGNIFPISFEKWSNMPDSYFDACFDEIIKPRFMFKTSEVIAKRYISQSIGKKWASHRQRLWTEFYDPTLSRDTLISNVPTGISRDQWAMFVDYRLKPETQTMCKRNAEIRKKQIIPHTGGSKSNSRRRAEIYAESGKKPGRGMIYLETHMNPDGSYVNEEAKQICEKIRNALSQSSTDEQISPDDVVGKVLGKEHPGRVRCLGLGAAPTNSFNPTTHRLHRLSVSSNNGEGCSSQFYQQINVVNQRCNDVIDAFKSYILMKEGEIPAHLAALFCSSPIRDMDLITERVPSFYEISDCEDPKAASAAQQVLKNTFRRHNQSLHAQLWAARGLDNICIKRIWEDCDHDVEFELLDLWKGRGVIVEKAFSSKGACLCMDVRKLSVSWLPGAPHARQRRISGCFAICLKSSKVDEFYISNFFWDAERAIDFVDPKTFVRKLVAELGKDIEEYESSPIQKIEDRLFIEVLKVDSDYQGEVDSFEICTDGSPPNSISRIQLVQNDMTQLDTSGTKQNDVRDGSNKEGSVTKEKGCATNKRSMRTRGVEYGITREILEQYSEMELEDVAEILHVSKATLKRICRKYGIDRWPPKRWKGPNNTVHRDSTPPIAAANENEKTDAQHHNMTSTRRREQDGGSIVVKATYGEDTLKFQLSFLAKKMDLDKQVDKRLNDPSVKSFKIKYLDEDNEWVSIACDEDLKLCIDTFRLQGKTTIRLSIN